jgi:hypothetical protein
MNKKKDITDFNIETDAPTLFNIKKEGDFNVPDNYFKKLPLEIQKKVIVRDTKVVSIWANLKYIVPALAASIFGLVFFYNINSNKVSLPELTAEDILITLEYEEYYNVESNLLASTYAPEGDNEQSNEEEIIDYLLYENIDIDAIYY